MQKLFSMFPRGAPGLALLLLRVIECAALSCNAVTALTQGNTALAAVLVACALAILVGFTTPIAAVLAALLQAIALHEQAASLSVQSIAPMAIALALAPLGPGAYSVDARLFGRRLIQFGSDGEDNNQT
jgi:uncharacterized membrane protein YphA (DoxX/SURF4 family)